MGAREKFASQADPEVLAAMREAAAGEGRQLQAVIEDAMREYLERRATDRPRPQVVQALAESIAEFDSLYARLAQ
ncbi:MAG: hypothetical protein JHD05_03580 [Thermoleophilia bacterium]|jgi:hypothetical protein|nr:hypothetical protein [Thermoleophilia bacterium]MBJ7333687.1 hypothetical protein [Thermoleophilia bacterium]MCX6411363.1 hypothetical protein [Actinomycetota bacterium]